MGSKSSKAPKAPDPVKTAEAQAKMNIDTALTQNAINRVNQVGPDGSLTYTQTGTQYVNGRAIPIYTATTSLSPEQQKIKTETDAAEYNLANAANVMSGKLNKEPFKVNEQVEANLFDLGNRRLAPRLAEARRQAENDAANRGLRLGSDAYDRLMRQVGENENDAYNQLALTGRAQAYAEADTDYNRDLNRISALLSGSQVSSPHFVDTPQAGVANTDYASGVWNKYNADMAAYQQQQADKNAMLGGLFGLAGTAITMSDRRLKQDVKKVGRTDDGQNIYAYRYKVGGPLRLGLIAQEVEKKRPGAVVTGPDGYKRVDYRKALRLGEGARQTEGLVPTPRPHPFRDPDRFSYTGEVAEMAKDRGVPAYDQLAFKMAPGTLSRLANLQTAYGRPLEVNAAYSPARKGRHKPNGAHPRGQAFDLNVYPATDAERARAVELATQMGFVGTGTYQSPEDTKKGIDDPRVHIDVMSPRPWGHDGTSKTTPPWHRAAIARGLAAGEPDMEAIAAEVAKGYPIFGSRRRGPLQRP